MGQPCEFQVKHPVADVTNASQYCVPAASAPEQINLQYAAPGVVVVGFVTYEEAPTEAPPRGTRSPQSQEAWCTGSNR
jgi:hypothetical protein